MYDSPLSLTDLCLNSICKNYYEIFEEVPAPAPSNQQSQLVASQKECSDIEITSDDNEEEEEEDVVYRFYGDFYLCNELSERLLLKFVEKNMLTDQTLNIFRGANTMLKNVKIRRARITPEGLRVLREHKLNALQCTNVENLTVGMILDCLNEHTIRNLTYLNVSQCTFIDISRHSMMMHLTNLKRLKSLNVSFTEFNQQTLEMVCEDLTSLEMLDISGTWVQCIKPLLQLKHQLLSLVCSDLRGINSMTSDIIELYALKHLDISLIHERFEGVQNTAICDILESPEKLPNLVSLDISGWRDLITSETLLTYIRQHPELKYLGLVMNPITFELFLSEPEPDLEVQIAGMGNEEQLKLALRRHHDRHSFAQKCLYHLYQITECFTSSRTELFQIVLLAMSAHPKRFGVQMAATACLYNLTRGEFAKQIHPKYLSKAVRYTLNAMEAFPEEFQLQKNALLTLCSDRILQEVSFDRYRCAKIVLDSLCTFSDMHLNRMAVAICSILAAKISTRETSQLGGQAAYMQKLLAMVQSRVENRNAGITLKFTLSALWNLTDESTATCIVFLENGGAELFLEVLRVFKKDATVETKVLGLLNNIAEVPSLREQILVEPLINEVHELLTYDMIDVSYFAAGIVAHLASDGEEKWTVTERSRESMLVALEKAVINWGIPDSEMVAYRSFKPFLPLLQLNVDYRVQLWAVWAVHHVCTKNPKRYCRMLRREYGVRLLQHLIHSPQSHEVAREKCSEVLKFFHLRPYQPPNVICTATIINTAAEEPSTSQQEQEDQSPDQPTSPPTEPIRE